MRNYGSFLLMAKVTFLTTEVGGRGTSPGSGYRGQFFYNGQDCAAVHTFEDGQPAPLGQDLISMIILSIEHYEKVKPGLMFLIREGPHTVGYGQVLEVEKIDDEN